MEPEILQRLSVATRNDESFPDESFFEMLMKCQGSRIEDQRSSLPNAGAGAVPGVGAAPVGAIGAGGAGDIPLPPHAPTVPDEDFFSLIQKIQSGRLGI